MQKQVSIKNKRARFEYELIDQYTAGIVLTGTEIKSIRASNEKALNFLPYWVYSQGCLIGWYRWLQYCFHQRFSPHNR